MNERSHFSVSQSHCLKSIREDLSCFKVIRPFTLNNRISNKVNVNFPLAKAFLDHILNDMTPAGIIQSLIYWNSMDI